jgi:type II secretory pathway component PulM
MRSLRIVLPSHAVLELNPRHLLLLCAAVAAAGLLLTYVGLLHDAVARGAQWRADHQTSASPHSAKAPRMPRATL